jgi:hypothetical protein
MSSFPEISAAVADLGAIFRESQKSQGTKLDELKSAQAAVLERVEELESRRGNPGKTGAKGGTIEQPAFELVDKDGRSFPALTKSQSCYDYVRNIAPKDEGDDGFVSLGEHVRSVMLGRKLSSSTATVPTRISAQIIDDVRAQLALVQAGATTIPIVGPTNMARITADVTVIAHTEAANDITESSPTLVAVALNPGTLAALVPLSLEIVQDSPNLDAILRTALAGAFASKLDVAGITTILADTAIPDSAAAHDPATWSGTNLAVAAAMTANQPLPDACVVNSGNFITRHSLLASTAGSWLGKPPYLEDMREIPTTSMTVDVSVLGGFQRGVAIAMRMDLTTEIIRYGKPTYGSHYLMAVMRAAVVVLQPKALFHQKKVP